MEQPQEESIRSQYEAHSRQIEAFQKRIAISQACIERLQKACAHPDLPDRQVGEEYLDECPDCGFVQYCYRA